MGPERSGPTSAAIVTIALLTLIGLCVGANGTHEPGHSEPSLLSELVHSPDFEDILSRSFETILSDKQLAEYSACDHLEREAYRRRFWQRRDPTPATEENEFLEEHLRRLDYALLNFCPGGDYDWDGRGDAALRFGLPSSRERIIGDICGVAGAMGIVPNSELWMYADSDLLLQFIDPSLNGRYVMGFDIKYTTARVGPGTLADETLVIPPGAPLPGSLYSLALTDPMKRPRDRGLKAAEEVDVAYGYEPPCPPLSLFYEIVIARGDGGASDVAVNSGIPADELSFVGDRELSPTTTLVKRIRILSTAYDVLTSDARTLAITRDSAEAPGPFDLIVDEWRIDAAPDTYIVEISVEDTLTGRTGQGRSLVVVSDYPPARFAMSDIQLASAVGTGDRFSRMGGSVVPRPTHAFNADEQMIIYFELYGLAEDAPGRSRFTVTTEISGREHEKERNWLATFVSRLFPKRRHAVSSSVMGSGGAPDAAYWFAVSLDNLPQDNYDLVVTVRDVRSRQETTRSAAFTVLEN